MDRAAWATARGVTALDRVPFESPGEARAAITDFYELLRALESHTWTVLDPRRVPGITAAFDSDPRERAAAVLLDALQPVVRDYPQLPPPDRTSTAAWVDAARCVRAATELVKTHRDLEGAAPRTPDVAAVLNHPAARQAALARVGDLTAAVLAAETRLGLRALQAMGHRSRVRRVLPGHPVAEAAARDLAGPRPLPADPHLEDLTVAAPGVRTDTLVEEVADRMLRLRRAAWAGPHAAHPSVETIKAFATLGVAVHAHALANRGHQPSRTPGPALTDPGVARLVDRARAWAGITRDLFSWRTPAPVDPAVAGDVGAVTTLLRGAAPLVGPQPNLGPVDAAQLREVLAGAVEMTSDIARWNVATLRVLAQTGQLHVPARSLRGDQVSGDLHLVQAKLTGGLTPAPDDAVAAVAAAYEAVITRPDARLLGAGGLTLRAQPLRLDAATLAGAGIEPVHRSLP